MKKRFTISHLLKRRTTLRKQFHCFDGHLKSILIMYWHTAKSEFFCMEKAIWKKLNITCAEHWNLIPRTTGHRCIWLICLEFREGTKKQSKRTDLLQPCTRTSRKALRSSPASWIQ